MGILSAVGQALGAGIDYVTGKRSDKQARLQFNLQRTQAIQDRVKDAKAAGIHPLYALGTGMTSSPTFLGSGQSRTGSKVGEALEQLESAGIEKAKERSLNASAERDEAQAAMTNSERKRREMNVNINQDQGSPGGQLIMEDAPLPKGRVFVKPSEVTSPSMVDPSRAAGTGQMWRRIRSGTNRDGTPDYTTIINTDDLGEAFEIGGLSMMLARKLGLFGPPKDVMTQYEFNQLSTAEKRAVKRAMARSRKFRKNAPARYGLGR